ncbi:phosphoribosylformylglycinamidine cyclo-ligase [Treponema primitia ZAS-2]|uniref:Phosphoribosylformylglycinamidine cyclo-ligase n=1 Tax=Treponema primitia (strain ATCC BAA-887 / DSM 12427 / ZAS-2) TaxID=545694 RepID=F5YPR0_TREPZ|nr:phosphoribosylformylglycinamidine cyclo-ligase [Treponema primitia]AEF87036.1 phosphoribosylformylglycinamidine cyclo-ligase [Treponema primitia ZAS-2]
MDYKQAGVNIEEGYRAVGKYRDLAASTGNASVLNGLGSFAGMLSIGDLIRAGQGMEEPVLVSGTDGVGTKLDIAFRLKKYDTVGIDCVAMCVNDVLCHGARPLFFLDYLACGKLDADVAADFVKGVATGCRETGSVLLGGETAEMPGFYDEGKYDIAGFSVGIVDKEKIVDGRCIQDGDLLVGIASSGPHSNGFSLIRRVLPDLGEDFGGISLGQVLLEPTRLYVKPILTLLEQVAIRGMAHITGGGFYENIPRMFFAEDGKTWGFDAVIKNGSWPIPPIFARIAYGVNGGALTGAAARETGAKLLETDAALRKLMFNTYNMGIGFVLALAPGDSGRAIEFLNGAGFPARVIGRVEAGGSGELRFE